MQKNATAVHQEKMSLLKQLLDQQKESTAGFLELLREKL